MNAAGTDAVPAGDAREDYEAPELHHVGDVSAITQTGFTGCGSDMSYS